MGYWMLELGHWVANTWLIWPLWYYDFYLFFLSFPSFFILCYCTFINIHYLQIYLCNREPHPIKNVTHLLYPFTPSPGMWQGTGSDPAGCGKRQSVRRDRFWPPLRPLCHHDGNSVYVHPEQDSEGQIRIPSWSVQCGCFGFYQLELW